MAHRRLLTFELKANPDRPDWEPFHLFFHDEVNTGLADWQLDLRKITFLDSLSLGTLVSINALVSQRGGHLTLLVSKASQVAKLINISKIDRLISVTPIG